MSKHKNNSGDPELEQYETAEDLETKFRDSKRKLRNAKSTEPKYKDNKKRNDRKERNNRSI